MTTLIWSAKSCQIGFHNSLPFGAVASCHGWHQMASMLAAADRATTMLGDTISDLANDTLRSRVSTTDALLSVRTSAISVSRDSIEPPPWRSPTSRTVCRPRAYANDATMARTPSASRRTTRTKT